jgi:hypothetical protein
MTTGAPQSLADEQRDEFVRAEFLRGLPDPASRHEKVGSMAMEEFTRDELDLMRQWFNATQDLNPGYLEASDYDLADRICDLLGHKRPSRPPLDRS